MMTCIGLLRLLSWEAGSSGVVQDICPKYLLVWGRRNIFVQNICHLFKQALREIFLAGPNAINFLQTVRLRTVLLCIENVDFRRLMLTKHHTLQDKENE